MIMKLRVVSMIAVLSAVTVSCINSDYDISEKEFDMTVSIGGDSLALPIGTTAKIPVSSFMDYAEGSTDMIVVRPDGSLAFSMKETQSVDIQKINSSDLASDDFSVSSDITMSMPDFTGLPSPGYPVELPEIDLPFDENVQFSMDFGSIGSEIVSIDAINLEARFLINISLKEIPDLGDAASVRLSGSIRLPDCLVLSGNYTDNTVLIDELLTSEVSDISVGISAVKDIVPSDDGTISIDETVEFTGSLSITDAVGDVDQVSGAAVLLAYEVGIVDIVPESIECKVDYTLAPEKMNISLEDLPDMLRSDDVNIDLLAPSVSLVLRSNVSMPVSADLRIVPYIDGVPDEGNVLSTSIDLPSSEDPSDYVESRYVLADSREYLDDRLDGYTFVQMAISDLISLMPERLEVEVSGSTDPEEPALIVLDTQYDVDMEYEVDVPFMFGKDFSASAVQVMELDSQISGIISDMFSKGKSIVLGGSVTNSIPLDFGFRVMALDENGDILPVSSDEVMVQACNGDGTPYTDEFRTELKVEGGAVLEKNICGLQIEVFLKGNESVEGIALSEDDFVQLGLFAVVVGGVDIDLSELSGETVSMN